MSTLFLYLLKLSVSLAVVFLFYEFVLKRLTFYSLNRYYLLAYTLLSFYIPFIDISDILEKNKLTNNQVISWVPTIADNNATIVSAANNINNSLTIWDWLLLIVVAGILLLLVRLLVQLFSLRRILKKATIISNEGVNVYQINKPIIPFSFGNSIFINQSQHSDDELQKIIQHEFIHVKQKHTIDIALAEILCILNWYNPFAWLLKKAIRQNLEFIADNKVLQNGIEKKEYQYLLLKVIGNNQFSIAQKFNFSSLKKRISMMNKFKSSKKHLIKFLFIVPLLVVLLLSFREKISNAEKEKFNKSLATIDTPKINSPNSKGNRIAIIDNFGNCTLVIKNKDNKELIKVLLNDWMNNQKHYEDIYGEVLDQSIVTANAASKSEESKFTFSADTLIWHGSAKRQLELKGHATLISDSISVGSAQNNSIIISANNIFIDKTAPLLVLINGQVANNAQPFTAPTNTKFKLTTLQKEEALKKYGEKGKNGAIEIETVPSINKQEPTPTVHPFLEKVLNPEKDMC